MRRAASSGVLAKRRKSITEIEDKKRKQILLDYMYLQAKTPNTKYNNLILCTFKIIQSLMSFACLVVHIYAYVGKTLPMPHNTLFCGTYLGYTIVSSGLIIGYVVGRRASPVMDLCICLMGGTMYNISGLLSLVYAQTMAYELKNGKYYVLHKEFLICCVAQSIISSVSGLMYWIDFFINLDIYQGMRRRRRSVLLDGVIDTLDEVESDEFEDVISSIGISSEKEDELTPLQKSVSLNISQLLKEEEAEQEKRTRKTLITEDDELELHCICIEGFYFCKNLLAPLLKKETYKGKFRRREPDPEYDIEEFLVLDKYYREHDARFNAYLRQTGSHSQFYTVSRVRI